MANAELIIVNTCSVREKGEHKLFSLLGVIRELKSLALNSLLVLVVALRNRKGSRFSSAVAQ